MSWFPIASPKLSVAVTPEIHIDSSAPAAGMILNLFVDRLFAVEVDT
jgi:hypothetical protein